MIKIYLLVINFFKVKYIGEEIEKDKNSTIQKKILENEALQQTLIQNEENRKIQAQIKERERLEDIRSMEEYSKVLEKQENERKAYFRNIESKANSFLAKMSQTVLKDIDNKNKMEEEKISKYLQEKEERQLAKDKEKLEQIRLQKREMRHFLDKQVEEKKMYKDFDKFLDGAQAKIWNTDREVNKEQSAIINGKVSNLIIKYNVLYFICR